MDRSKQRIFKILNLDFILKIPIEEDQTEKKFLIINLEQGLIKIILNMKFTIIFLIKVD